MYSPPMTRVPERFPSLRDGGSSAFGRERRTCLCVFGDPRSPLDELVQNTLVVAGTIVDVKAFDRRRSRSGSTKRSKGHLPEPSSSSRTGSASIAVRANSGRRAPSKQTRRGATAAPSTSRPAPRRRADGHTHRGLQLRRQPIRRPRRRHFQLRSREAHRVPVGLPGERRGTGRRRGVHGHGGVHHGLGITVAQNDGGAGDPDIATDRTSRMSTR
jgi:hypothetical protein